MAAIPAFAVAEIRLPITEVAGLPLHPLIVHAVVVLVPLASLGLIVMASSGHRSTRYSPAVVFVAAVATVAAFFAMLTGQEFRREKPGLQSVHFTYGEYLPWVTLGLLVVVCVLALMDRRGGGGRNTASTIVAVVAVLVAIGATALTVVTGHSGAEMVWG